MINKEDLKDDFYWAKFRDIYGPVPVEIQHVKGEPLVYIGSTPNSMEGWEIIERIEKPKGR